MSKIFTHNKAKGSRLVSKYSGILESIKNQCLEQGFQQKDINIDQAIKKYDKFEKEASIKEIDSRISVLKDLGF